MSAIKLDKGHNGLAVSPLSHPRSGDEISLLKVTHAELPVYIVNGVTMAGL